MAFAFGLQDETVCTIHSVTIATLIPDVNQLSVFTSVYYHFVSGLPTLCSLS